MKTNVALVKCPDYSEKNIKFAIESIFSSIWDLKKNIKQGSKVLIKPNILSNSEPHEAITTHPQVVKAIVLKLKEIGAEVWIGDSPGLGTLETVSVKSGFKELAKELDVTLKPFDEKIPIKTKSGYVINIAKAVIDADFVINVPKVKSHVQMFMTLGVKNCFGCIPGTEKAQWHFRAGINEDKFANMLLDTYSAVNPVITIIDGVIGLEGDGPGTGGVPKKLGFLAGSKDAIALDRVIMDVLDLDHFRLRTLKIAGKLGLGETNIDNIDIKLDSIESLKIKEFKVPQRVQPLQFKKIPKFLRKYVREFLTSKPVIVDDDCLKCGKCFNACPAKTITWQKGSIPKIHYEECIRCFCCMEMCPNDSIKTQDGYGLKILEPFRDFLLKKYGI